MLNSKANCSGAVTMESWPAARVMNDQVGSSPGDISDGTLPSR